MKITARCGKGTRDAMKMRHHVEFSEYAGTYSTDDFDRYANNHREFGVVIRASLQFYTFGSEQIPRAAFAISTGVRTARIARRSVSLSVSCHSTRSAI
jgi:hypothetical protein